MDWTHYQERLGDPDAWQRWADYVESDEDFLQDFDDSVFVAYKVEDGDLYVSAAGPKTSVNEFPEEIEVEDVGESPKEYVGSLTEEEIVEDLEMYLNKIPGRTFSKWFKRRL